MKFYSIAQAFINPKFAIYALSKKYIKYYEGFSYNFTKNGEEFLLNSLKNESINVVFDVGANTGEWTKIALNKFKKAKIHSFELSNETYKTLQKNLTSKKKRTCLINAGLSNQEQKVLYKDYGKNSRVNTIISEARFHDSRIKPKLINGVLKTGDIYCQKKNIQNIDFLKIDVEGAEHLVLEGFQNMLKKKSIKIIQFEYGYASGDAKFLMKDFFNLLNKYNYIVGPLKPNGVYFMNFEYPLNDFNSGPNYVAILKSEPELIKKVSGQILKGFPR
ncbi:FkbM family methyltransferase [Candidatus Methylopumilus planktonicus]|uniref:FkbM family methyltransferase n=1 Tax=Candidatus Methylopumilus planktonicus TaxID=1581557 RepID=UPI001122096C|nr:FkbM family methyltransferase [Candidatus Methylopumilus planktonicus]QDD00472.1 FkbM family methyltransferase [Candidatus Methylopumilus planktonicus]